MPQLSLPPSSFLSDYQWSLLQPIFPTSSRGRPPLDNRLVLELIFLKLVSRLPWYDLPSASPSWQTLYQRFHTMQRSGLWKSILLTLLDDLSSRGHLDLSSLVQSHDLSVKRLPSGELDINCPPDLENTWQLSTAVLVILMLFPDL